MAVALAQSRTGSASTATVNPAFTGPSTTGNLIVLAFNADDYNGTPNAGWTQSTGMEQQTNSGGYLWWRVSTGETSVSYTINSASYSSWVLIEFSGTDTSSPYDISNGQFQASAVASYTTPAIAPSVGNRVLVAMIGTALSGGGQTAPASWTNSFTSIAGVAAGANPDAIGTSYRLVTGNGSTTYSTGASWTGGNAQTEVGLIASFKEAVPVQEFLPDADTVTTGWTATPLYSKLSDASDATVVTATLV